ncbi:hypothetical protein HXX76_007995 [Chlamydomonas incerta]|uniref:Uncharacterized protein n=1 Tax=Chlamydomonas incerta TaxID=51695 RepID=A0A835TA13_CHLIN|nr:hypothetical protein HXX76_007995 [Chlamydomonas incerta]|eukprot:KAG2434270.1 hypothetical protein HXX76_007995 [Chlamydomonas incerta]
MVVYALPGDVHLPPKKRHFGQGDATSACKRNKHEAGADVLPADTLPGLSLGADGGVWHVDGLLELLAGALCSALGTDGLHSDAPPAGPSGADAALAGSVSAAHAASPAEPAPASACGHQLRTAAAASTAFDVLRSNLPALTIPRPPAAPAADELEDEDDRSSVASLSAWVAGTPSRRRGSEVAAGHGSISAGGTPLSGFINFSFGGGFTPRAAKAAQAAAAAAPCNSCESVGSDAAAAWPRRRLSGAGCR